MRVRGAEDLPEEHPEFTRDDVEAVFGEVPTEEAELFLVEDDSGNLEILEVEHDNG